MENVKVSNNDTEPKYLSKCESSNENNYKKISGSYKKFNILEIGQQNSFKYKTSTRNIIKHPKIPNSWKHGSNFVKKSDSFEKETKNRDEPNIKKDETYSELSRNFAELEKASYDQNVQNKKGLFNLDKPLEKKSKNKEKSFKMV